MEWTKENLKRTFIICINKKQAEKAKEIYETNGYEFWGKIEKERLVIGTIGIFENRVMGFKESLITLYKDDDRFTQIPRSKMFPRRKFPREMWVSIDNVSWYKKLVFGKVKNHYAYIAEYSTGSSMGVSSWKYAKEIDDRTAS